MPRRVLERLALALFLVLLILTAWIGDDAYITFRTVENASAGHGLRWNVAERVQAFTHPLWCLLLLVARPLATPYWAAMALSSACSAAAFVAVLRLAPSSGAVLVAAATLLSSMAFVHFSTSGLENPVLHLLLALFATVWLDERRPPWRTFALFLLSALLAMTRLDCLLLVAPALAYHLWRERQRGWRAAAAAGLLPIVAWEAFALVYYGFPFPNTAYAKLQTGVSGWDLARQGVEYVRDCAERDPVTIVALAAGLIAAGRRAAADRALAIGLLGYVMFVIRVGGDFMLGRFFSGPLVVAVVLATRACGTWSTRASTAAAAAAGALGLLAVEPTLTVVRGHHVVPSRGRNGIAVERSYYAPATGLAQCTLAARCRTFRGPTRAERPAAGRLRSCRGLASASSPTRPGPPSTSSMNTAWAIRCLPGCRRGCPRGVSATSDAGCRMGMWRRLRSAGTHSPSRRWPNTMTGWRCSHEPRCSRQGGCRPSSGSTSAGTIR